MTSTGFEDARTATVNGTTLAYREQGEGEPVVFVHGAISDLRTWEQQLPGVGRSYRAITYSRRFARPNEDIGPSGDDPWLQQVEDLVAFLREIEATPAHLVGNSYGAYLCLLAAIRRPDVVRSLVLEEPPVIPLFFANWPPRPAEVLRLFATRPRSALAVFRWVARGLLPVQGAFQRGEDDKAMRIFCIGVLRAAPYARLPEARKQQIRDNLSTLRVGFLHAGGFPPLSADEVRAVRVPALLAVGAHSPTALHRLTDRLEELLASVERVEIPRASHFMHEENASAVNQAIVEFLKRARDGSTSPPVA